MNDPTLAVPAVPNSAPDDVRAHDPLAVALGNASLLGVGYLMLRRRRLALAAVVVTVVPVSRLVSTADSAYEVAVLGWFLARGGGGGGGGRGGGAGRGAVRGRRLVAIGVTLPVLVAVGLLRFDASRIGQSVTDARIRGECAGVLSAQDEVWFGHRIADAPLSARGDDAVRACARLRTARTELATALTGDTDALKQGFGTLASVLAEPGNEKTVETTLDGFLRDLPTKDSCETITVTDWLHDRKRTDDVLDRSADTAERTEPGALAGCGDDLMADDSWEQARTHYQQLLDRYPDDDLADRARKGARKATLNIELANVRNLLSGGTDTQPEYCSHPAKYSGAEPVGKGTNRALFYASDEYSIASDYPTRFPGSWKAGDAADAVLVVCMGEDAHGPSVETCPYESESSGALSYVSFHKIEIPVKVYELRTGKLVTDRTIRIGGTSCPSVVYAEEGSDPGPMYVKASKSDVNAAFRPLVVR